MAISTDATIHFFGTQDEQTTSSAAVSANAFSVAGDTSEWTNDDDAPMAAATLAWSYGTAPSAGTTIDLFVQKLEVEGANDDSVPTSDNPYTYLGSYINDDTTGTQRQTIDIALPNFKTSSKYTAFIRNNEGTQAISAGWQLWFTPKTYGPHA